MIALKRNFRPKDFHLYSKKNSFKTKLKDKKKSKSKSKGKKPGEKLKKI
jgi:hypothetical protein